MAVLVMEMIRSDLSFVLHTVNPLDRDATLLSAEMAVGLGETLASGTRGSPWRFAIDKADCAHTDTMHAMESIMHDELLGRPTCLQSCSVGPTAIAGTVTVQSFANFSTALYGGREKQQGIVDYSQQALSISDKARQQVCHCEEMFASLSVAANALHQNRQYAYRRDLSALRWESILNRLLDVHKTLRAHSWGKSYMLYKPAHFNAQLYK